MPVLKRQFNRPKHNETRPDTTQIFKTLPIMQLRTVVAGPGCVSIFFNLLKLILRLCVVCRRILQQKSTGVISGEGVIMRFSTNCHCAKKCQIETGCRFFPGPVAYISTPPFTNASTISTGPTALSLLFKMATK